MLEMISIIIVKRTLNISKSVFEKNHLLSIYFKKCYKLFLNFSKTF